MSCVICAAIPDKIFGYNDDDDDDENSIWLCPVWAALPFLRHIPV